MPAPVFSLFAKFKPRKSSANMLVFHNFLFAKDSKTSQAAGASLWLTAHVPAAWSTWRPQCHEDAQCQLMLEFGCCHQTSAGLPWGPPVPHDTLHQHSPIISSFCHQLCIAPGIHVGMDLLQGDLWVGRGDGGGRVLGMAMGCFTISAAPVLPAVAAELPGSLPRLLRLILRSAAQHFITHLSKMYISLLRALLE